MAFFIISKNIILKMLLTSGWVSTHRGYLDLDVKDGTTALKKLWSTFYLLAMDKEQVIYYMNCTSF